MLRLPSEVNFQLLQVYEETGYDINGKTNREDYIEVHAGPQRIKLYIVTGVPENTCFKPLAQKASCTTCNWHLSNA